MLQQSVDSVENISFKISNQFLTWRVIEGLFQQSNFLSATWSSKSINFYKYKWSTKLLSFSNVAHRGVFIHSDPQSVYAMSNNKMSLKLETLSTSSNRKWQQTIWKSMLAQKPGHNDTNYKSNTTLVRVINDCAENNTKCNNETYFHHSMHLLLNDFHLWIINANDSCDWMDKWENKWMCRSYDSFLIHRLSAKWIAVKGWEI